MSTLQIHPQEYIGLEFISPDLSIPFIQLQTDSRYCRLEVPSQWQFSYLSLRGIL